MSSLTKMEKKVEAAAAKDSRMRQFAKQRENDLVRKGTGLVSSGLLGLAEKSGNLARIPNPTPFPRTMVLAGIFQGASLFAPAGKIRAGLDGAGESLTAIATYKLTMGMDVAGVDEVDVGGPRRARKRIKAEARRQSERIRALEARLSRQADEEFGPASNDGADDAELFADFE